MWHKIYAASVTERAVSGSRGSKAIDPAQIELLFRHFHFRRTSGGLPFSCRVGIFLLLNSAKAALEKTLYSKQLDRA